MLCSGAYSRTVILFFFSSRRRHTRFDCDWSSDVCSSDLRTPDTVFLLGPRYALLDPRYAEPPQRSDGERVRRTLICLGGGNHDDTILKALWAVDAALDDCVVDVAVGPFSHDWTGLDAAARGTRHRVSIHRDRFGL